MWAGMAPGQVKNRTLGREQTHIHSWVGSSEPGPCKNADIFQSGVEACNLIGKGSNMGRHRWATCSCTFGWARPTQCYQVDWYAQPTPVLLALVSCARHGVAQRKKDEHRADAGKESHVETQVQR